MMGRCQTQANTRQKRALEHSVKRQTEPELALTFEIRERLSLECTELRIYQLREIQFVFTKFMQASAQKTSKQTTPHFTWR